MADRPALTREEAAARAGVVTGVATDIRLDLTAADAARVWTRTTFRCRRAGAATFIDAGFTVTSARLNGEPVAAGDGRIALDEVAERNTLEVEGEVVHRRDGQGLHRFVDPVDGRVYLHTKFQPFDAHHVFACFDQPDIKGPVTLTVTAPSDWQVVGNARPVATEKQAGGATVWQFAPTAPLPAYLVAVVAGPYASVRHQAGGLDVGLHVRPALAGRLDVAELVELTARGRRYYEDLFGIAYPFGDHYDIAFVPEYGFGAMEHPGCVTAHERFVFRDPPTGEQARRRSEVLLHEMAHMWFGNLVTLRWWDDLWLNESFATLLAALAQSEATETGSATWATFAADAKVRARDADRLPTTHPVHGEVPDTGRVRAAFDAITYRKGAALLQQRLHETGRQRFMAGLSAFLREHAHGNATAAELHEALGPARGRAPGEWAAVWLGTTGAAELHVGAGGPSSAWWRLELVAPAGRAMPALEVTLDRLARQGDRLVTSERQVVSLAPGEPVELPAAPGEVAVVPNADDGVYATVVPGAGLVEVFADGVGAIDDPVTRAVVWGALWEAVIDGRLPTGRYVDAVVAHALAEEVAGVRQVVLERAAEGVWNVPGAAAPDSARDRLASFAGAALAYLDAGGDRHRLLADVLAATAVSGADLDSLRAAGAAYAGGAAGAHLELRWRVMAGRCRAGDADDRAVTELLAEDGGDIARRGALRARASRPAAPAKAEAWERALGDEVSLAERQALLEGWAAPGHDELRRPYEVLFTGALVELERRAGPESALVLARTAFPRWPADRDALVASARRLVDDGAVSDAVGKAVVEQLALLDRRLPTHP